MPEGIQWAEASLHKPVSHAYPQAKAKALHAHGWLLAWLQQFD